MDDSTKTGVKGFDLSELTSFQFVPAWARKDGPATDADRIASTAEKMEQRSFARRPADEKRRSRWDRQRTEDRPKFQRRGQGNRPPETRIEKERVQPTEGFRVELRPANSILEVFSKEIQKQKRSLPLMDLARVVMAKKERYDLVFMKLENGSMLIRSRKEDGACWLTEEEALAYLQRAPWFSEYYTTEQVATEPPKGAFTAIATCDLGGEVIGPVNWHGYQSALLHLHRSKYSTMPLNAFKQHIRLDKNEENLAIWLETASRKTVWRPTREEATETVLEDSKAVEADFKEHHFSDVYEITDKVFINGATPRNRLSPGLEAHLHTQSERTRRFPQMLIPNLCHGLARHHLPIYKWHGNHFTGPSRVRAIPADMVLADRMAAIVKWTRENSGKKLDAMFSELSGVSAGSDEESKNAATEAYAPYVADMIWLLEQGFIVVTSDNAIWYPKGDVAPAPVNPDASKRRGKRKFSGQNRKQEKTPPSSPDPAVASPHQPETALPSNESSPFEENPSAAQ